MIKHKKLGILLGSILIVLLACVVTFFVYVNIYYHADETAFKAMESTEDIRVEEHSCYYSFEPQNYDTGLIFYPGGKVEEESYAPLMRAFAKEGILAILVQMPFRLAVFGVNRAETVLRDYGEVDHWYIGGHSLGGSMASSFLAGHQDSFDGLILLGSYATEDFSQSDLKVFSIYGEFDGVLNHRKYQENLVHLPEDVYEYILPGGCHAYFGSYGKQDKDGTPTIEPAEQVAYTVDFIIERLLK